MAVAPLTIPKHKTAKKPVRTGRAKHVTQRLAARVVGCSEATLGRWVVELGESEFPEWGSPWALPDVVRAALFSSMARCPACEKNRDHVIDVFKMIRRSLLDCFGEGLKIVVFWSKGDGLAVADDRSMVSAMLEGSDNATAVTWTMDVGIVVASTVSAYRNMLRTEGLTDRESELEAAAESASYWRQEENIGTLAENGQDEAKELLK